MPGSVSESVSQAYHQLFSLKKLYNEVIDTSFMSCNKHLAHAAHLEQLLRNVIYIVYHY